MLHLCFYLRGQGKQVFSGTLWRPVALSGLTHGIQYCTILQPEVFQVYNVDRGFVMFIVMIVHWVHCYGIQEVEQLLYDETAVEDDRVFMRTQPADGFTLARTKNSWTGLTLSKSNKIHMPAPLKLSALFIDAKTEAQRWHAVLMCWKWYWS